MCWEERIKKVEEKIKKIASGDSVEGELEDRIKKLEIQQEIRERKEKRNNTVTREWEVPKRDSLEKAMEELLQREPSKSDSNRSILDKRNKHSHGKIERSETENNCFDQEEQSKSEERIYPQWPNLEEKADTKRDTFDSRSRESKRSDSKNWLQEITSQWEKICVEGGRGFTRAKFLE